MASKEGSLLATLAKRLLGFNTSSSACCAAPTASPDKALEAKDSAAKAAEATTREAHAHGAGCCAPSCCTPSAPAGSGTKPSR